MTSNTHRDIRAIYVAVRAGKDPDSDELHIDEDQFVQEINGLFTKKLESIAAELPIKYTDKDFDEAGSSEEQRMILVLKAHGFSLRSIGRLLNNLHPESVRYRISEAQKGKAV